MYYGGMIRRSLGLAVASFLVLVFLGFGPGFRYGGKRSVVRSCYANQKTLMGCVEMYQLDFNTTVETFDRAFLETLVDQGYLMTIPEDPGGGEGSWQNYYLHRDEEVAARYPHTSWQVMCLRHGFIMPPRGTSPEDGGMAQLAALGVDPGRAPREAPSSWLASGGGGDVDLLLGLVQIAAMVMLPLSLCAFLLLVLFEGAAWMSRGPPPLAPPRAPVESAGTGASPVDLTQAKCPVCADDFGAGTPVAALCPECRTPHHEPCLRYIGHCAVFACSRTEVTERRRKEAIEEKARTATG